MGKGAAWETKNCSRKKNMTTKETKTKGKCEEKKLDQEDVQRPFCNLTCTSCLDLLLYARWLTSWKNLRSSTTPTLVETKQIIPSTRHTDKQTYSRGILHGISFVQIKELLFQPSKKRYNGNFEPESSHSQVHEWEYTLCLTLSLSLFLSPSFTQQHQKFLFTWREWQTFQQTRLFPDTCMTGKKQVIINRTEWAGAVHQCSEMLEESSYPHTVQRISMHNQGENSLPEFGILKLQ